MQTDSGRQTSLDLRDGYFHTSQERERAYIFNNHVKTTLYQYSTRRKASGKQLCIYPFYPFHAFYQVFHDPLLCCQKKTKTKTNAGALSSSSDNMPYFSNHPNLFPFPPHHPNADRFQQFQRGKKKKHQPVQDHHHPTPVLFPPRHWTVQDHTQATPMTQKSHKILLLRLLRVRPPPQRQPCRLVRQRDDVPQQLLAPGAGLRGGHGRRRRRRDGR